MATILKLRPERFAEGMTIREYISGMKKNRELVEETYNNFRLRESDEAYLRNLDKNLKVMILAEDWCGDVVRYLPIFARIAEAASSWDVRVFYRDENADLADLCLKEGKYRAIPVFKFFTPDMEEMSCFIEKPSAVYTAETDMGARFAEQHPELPDAGVPTSEMSDETYAEYVQFVRRFRQENKPVWQQLFVEEIKSRIA